MESVCETTAQTFMSWRYHSPKIETCNLRTVTTSHLAERVCPHDLRHVFKKDRCILIRTHDWSLPLHGTGVSTLPILQPPMSQYLESGLVD